MGLQNCQIVLDKETKTYNPGEHVTGRVEYTFDSEKKIRGIKISVIGEANVSWDEVETYKNERGVTRNRNVEYSSHEEYFNLESYLLGGNTSDTTTLPSGKHIYPFEFSLPVALPSSFEGTKGYVRYTITTTLDRPWKFDQSTKIAFTIIAPFDLNIDPSLKEPQSRHKNKTFCFLCCSSGPLILRVSIPMTGFVPGQKLAVEIDCENGSNVDISKLKVVLYQNVTFISHIPTYKSKDKQYEIASVNVGVIRRHESYIAVKEIAIPSLPASKLENCSIINIHYKLKFNAVAPGCHSGPEFSFPITIGTIPIIQPATPVTPIDATNIGWNATVSSTVDSDKPPDYIAPPSYEESMFGTRSIERPGDSKNCFGEPNFAPRYPVYAFTATAPPPSP